MSSAQPERISDFILTVYVATVVIPKVPKQCTRRMAGPYDQQTSAEKDKFLVEGHKYPKKIGQVFLLKKNASVSLNSDKARTLNETYPIETVLKESNHQTNGCSLQPNLNSMAHSISISY
ncbi:hypothetical protein HS088_TW18G01035 [Tripterygium wilfordii]|uniref:Uncharacterized protein n=1 Tax=Tripterygium wilfordii TaxID=458696 RepID=A0A7J7CDU5_TRIWF|nr:hypothetical protein HS088_TW18G01035 [Tripterygium wilfordii]